MPDLVRHGGTGQGEVVILGSTEDLSTSISTGGYGTDVTKTQQVAATTLDIGRVLSSYFNKAGNLARGEDEKIADEESCKDLVLAKALIYKDKKLVQRDNQTSCKKFA